MGGVPVKPPKLTLTLQAIEALFEGKRILLFANGTVIELNIDPAELAMSKDMIEKAMLLHMHAPPSVN